MRISFVLFLLFAVGCNIDRTEYELTGYQGQVSVVYKTSKADFYLGYDDLVRFYSTRNSEAKNDLVDYVSDYKKTPIIIEDTVARLYQPDGSSCRNDSHEYSHIQDEIGWAILKFARQGNMKIYSQISDEFLESITLEEIDDNYSGTSALKQGDSTLHIELRWIK